MVGNYTPVRNLEIFIFGTVEILQYLFYFLNINSQIIRFLNNQMLIEQTELDINKESAKVMKRQSSCQKKKKIIRHSTWRLEERN